MLTIIYTNLAVNIRTTLFTYLIPKHSLYFRTKTGDDIKLKYFWLAFSLLLFSLFLRSSCVGASSPATKQWTCTHGLWARSRSSCWESGPARTGRPRVAWEGSGGSAPPGIAGHISVSSSSFSVAAVVQQAPPSSGGIIGAACSPWQPTLARG